MNLALPLAGLVWGAIHSPRVFDAKNSPVSVVWSNGCASSEEDILVGYRGNLYTARGSALVGDVVELKHSMFANRGGSVAVISVLSEKSWFCNLGSNLRTLMIEKSLRYPIDISDWFRGFVFGDKAAILPELARVFREVGLLHILVLSGGHLAVVATLLTFFLRITILPIYVFRKISMATWGWFWVATSFVMLLLLSSYCVLVGFSQSVQRAFITVAVMTIFTNCGVNINPRKIILTALTLQIILFPVNLFSMGMLLSWTGSLILLAFGESSYLKSFWDRLLLMVMIQLIFFASSLLFFGSSGIISPIINLVGHLVFGALLPIDIVAICIGLNWLDNYIIDLNRLVILGVKYAGIYQGMLPTPFVSIPNEITMSAPIGRALMVMFLMLLLWLSKFRGISKRT